MMSINANDDPRCSWMSGCTSCDQMHQGIYMDAQDEPYCSWVSWMLVVNKLCFEAPLGFIWMPLMQLDVLDVYGCPR